jgi:hypothetical protein
MVKISSSRLGGRLNYRKVAVLEVDAGVENVAAISERARGVRRIVRVWPHLNVGSTERCAYAQGLREAEALARELNVQESLATMATNCLNAA